MRPGGKLDPSARGVNDEEYLPAAWLGVTINIDADGRLVSTRVHREFSVITLVRPGNCWQPGRP
jgi:hypothetical protein